MRLSQYFLPVLRENPADAEIVSHRLMLRAGMIRQEAAGIYSWLPLGLRVLQRIERIVREEQNRINAHEILMPTIQPADLWKKSGRYDDYGKEMLRIRDRHDREMLYGPTNEEMISDIFRTACRSHRDVPRMLYHIQWKFRDELRPRFGVMRGREFLMKDAYSFDLTKEDARAAYNRQFTAYLRTYARLGLRAIPMAADTGPIGGDMSHEFIILADTGESQIWCHKALIAQDDSTISPNTDAERAEIVAERTSLYAATDEKHDQARFEAEVPEGERITARGIEVGHIFYFGTKYSAPLGAVLQNREGEMTPVEMGSYGVGVSRLVGAVLEASHDDAGAIWPESVAPFHVGVVNLKQGDAGADGVCEDIYAKLTAAGIETLYDDREERAGGKFATMDLIGLPWRVTVGPRGVARNVVELRNRRSGETHELSAESLLARLTGRASTASQA